MCVGRWGGVIFYGKTLGSWSRGMSSNQSAKSPQGNDGKCQNFLGGFVFHSSQRSALMSCRCGTVVNYQQLETTDHSGGAENLQPQRDVLDRSSESESEDVSFFSGFSFLVFLPHRPAFHRFVVGGNNVKIHGPSLPPKRIRLAVKR